MTASDLANPHCSSRRGVLGASLIALAGAAACAPPAETHAEPGQTAAAVELRLAMRKLWEDHITYTRNVIISALAGLPDLQAVTERLQRNQEDIGDAIKPYCGDAVGAQFSVLLRTHVTQTAEIIAAAKTGDQTQLAAKQAQWSANCRETAAFLSGVNPNWNRPQLETMLQRHLDLTTSEVVGRLHANWEVDINSYDEAHEHMLMLADALTNGVIAQHADMFAA